MSGGRSPKPPIAARIATLRGMQAARAAHRPAIDAGAAIDAPDLMGDTALHLAAHSLRKGIVELLLACGAKPNVRNRRGPTPLHALASYRGRDSTADDLALEVAKLLLDAGVSPGAADADGNTALAIALDTGSVKLASALRHHHVPE